MNRSEDSSAGASSRHSAVRRPEHAAASTACLNHFRIAGPVLAAAVVLGGRAAVVGELVCESAGRANRTLVGQEGKNSLPSGPSATRSRTPTGSTGHRPGPGPQAHPTKYHRFL